jgi:nitroreductase
MKKASAQTGEAELRLALPAPAMTGGRPLMDVLKARRSARAFSDRPIEPKLLADLLWAAFGVSREDGHRTAPSARNWQETDIYLARADGLYRYDASEGELERVLAEDIRADTGVQDFVAMAPLNLVYVADMARMEGASKDDMRVLAAADAGFISQNVYLFCASEGLATVVRALVDRPALARRMGLKPTQRIMLAQSVGYPAD